MSRFMFILFFLISVALAAGVFLLSLQVTQLEQRLMTINLKTSSLDGATNDSDLSASIKVLKDSLKETIEKQNELASTIAGLPASLRSEFAKQYAPLPVAILERPAYKIIEEKTAEVVVHGRLSWLQEWLNRNAFFLDTVLERGIKLSWNQNRQGYFVDAVLPFSPFDQMGIKKGDIITSIGNFPVEEKAPVRKKLLDLEAMRIGIVRQEQKFAINLSYSNDIGGVITLDLSREEFDVLLPKLLVSLKIAPAIKAGKVEGVKIIAIEPTNPLALMDFRDEDIITHINGEPVSNKTFIETLQSSESPLDIDFIRNDEETKISIKFAS